MKPLLFVILILFISFPLLFAEDDSTLAIEENLRDEQSFGSYTVRVYRERPIGFGLLHILKDDTLIYTEEGLKFWIGHIYEDIPEEPLIKIGNDITGDGEPNLVVSHWSGGAHCCFSFYVFSIGEEFKLIDKIEVDHSGSAKFKDVDDDGILEFIGNDWAFAYWYECFADSPAPDIILRYKDGKYRLAMDLMRKPLPDPEKEKKFIERIRTDNKPKEDDSFGWPVGDAVKSSEVWSHMLDLIYTGHPEAAWDFLNQVWPQDKPGKEEFIADFKEQLATSRYWESIKVTLK